MLQICHHLLLHVLLHLSAGLHLSAAAADITLATHLVASVNSTTPLGSGSTCFCSSTSSCTSVWSFHSSGAGHRGAFVCSSCTSGVSDYNATPICGGCTSVRSFTSLSCE
ncbi:hypothetical protein AMECASPLE_026815 [Ameca splendens]|uniref:Uncharacterized protein n=1 Tax=Ameca splendens TaxID=208324 RepID=A0ABV1A0K3_9TELE